MIKGIDAQDWYRSEAARMLRRHCEGKIGDLVASLRDHVSAGSVREASMCEGAIQALEELLWGLNQEEEP